MNRICRHTVVALGYLIAGVLLLECLLQLAAWLVQGQSRHIEARWLTGHTRILALGDSNTYGLYLEAVDSWPMQLERQWNANRPTEPVEVLNLGYPGTNSFRVRENLPALLDKLAPDMVLLMVGFNDFWTPRESVQLQYGSWLELVRSHSRLYRAWVMWQRQRIVQQDLAFGSPRPSEQVDPVRFMDPANIDKHLLHVDDQTLYMGVKPGEPARNMKALADNLAAMISMIRATGAEVALMTYPSNWGFYPNASKWIRKAGEANGVPVIEVTPYFIEHCPQGPSSCPELLFHDGHATAKGNAIVAGMAEDFLQGRLSH